MALLTIGKAAKLLGTTVATIREWSDKGSIQTVRTGGGHRKVPISEIRRISGGSVKDKDLESYNGSVRVYNFALYLSTAIDAQNAKRGGDVAVLSIGSLSSAHDKCVCDNETVISLVDDDWTMWTWYESKEFKDISILSVDKWDRPNRMVMWVLRGAKPSIYRWSDLDSRCMEAMVSEVTITYKKMDFNIIK